MANYQTSLVNAVTDATDTLFQNTELLKAPPTKTKKVNRSKCPKWDVRGRLELLRDEAVYCVLDRLEWFLYKLKEKEKLEAQQDTMKAAAQGRIPLPNVDPAMVKLVLNWLYKGSVCLSVIATKDVIQAYILATKLGLEELMGQCLDLLATAATRGITQAKCEGITLSDLLDQPIEIEKQGQRVATKDGSLSASKVVGEIFRFTLTADKPPAVLENLVANAIADSDVELYSRLVPEMSREMCGKVGMAMMHNKMVSFKAEQNDTQSYPDPSQSVSLKSDMMEISLHGT